jgi:NAD(P)-dependent dehydrogenase (short-subunit alcohol dehydrogenase family)
VFDELKGKTALVTGAAQGIGRVIARTLAGQGMRVMLADLQDDRATAVVGEIEAAGGTAAYIHADVGKADDCRNMVQEAVDRFGGLYALVNNARWHPHDLLAEVKEEDWDRSQDVLIKSHYLAAKSAIPVMIEGGGGSIVAISSVHAVSATPDEGPYEAAKAGLSALMRNIAVAYGRRGIRANTVLPGGIVTDVKEAAFQADPKNKELKSLTVPLGREGRPEDVAKAVLFLVSDLAAFITGIDIPVDGGEVLEHPSSILRRVLEAENRRSP